MALQNKWIALTFVLASCASRQVPQAELAATPICETQEAQKATPTPEPAVAEIAPKLNLQKVAYSELPGWTEDAVGDALPALRASCRKLMRRDDNRLVGRDEVAGRVRHWRQACIAAAQVDEKNTQESRHFFERYFTPFLAMNHDEPEGRFTGYYEASLRGSRTRKGPYQFPLYKRPSDLVMVNMRNFTSAPKRRRIAGKVVRGSLKPYFTRKQIRRGALANQSLELVWIDDPVDGFFTQIQGSGLVTLDDGSTMRIGYAAQNGHSYTAIGRELARDGHITKAQMSMQSIRAWLTNNPQAADEMMDRNHAYVFFQEGKGSGPVGSQNVALTPERSAAIDRNFIPQSVPLFIDTQILDQDGTTTIPFQQLLIAQDSGGAIRGPVRADIFWGAGERASAIAGHLKSRGRYFLLLPNPVAMEREQASSPAL